MVMFFGGTIGLLGLRGGGHLDYVILSAPLRGISNTWTARGKIMKNSAEDISKYLFPFTKVHDTLNSQNYVIMKFHALTASFSLEKYPSILNSEKMPKNISNRAARGKFFLILGTHTY